MARHHDPHRAAAAFLCVGNVEMPVARPLPRRLLGVWAHPDDECYLSAGLMARVVAAGGHVRLVCATAGELGTDDPGERGGSTFGRRRRTELAASLAELGVRDVHVLGLPDGGCETADHATMERVVEDHIGAIGADAVVTFGPDGITGHPDHRAVSAWATSAAIASGAEVLYAAMTHDFAERCRVLHDRLGLFDLRDGGRPATIARSSIALQCSLDDGELQRKRRALRCHASQTEQLAELVGEDVYRVWWRDEVFRHPTVAELTAASSGSAIRGEPIGASS